MASKPGRLIRYIHDRLLPKHKKETTYSSEEISQTSLRNFQQDTAYQEMISPGEVPSPGTDGLILLFQLEEFNQEEENSVQCPCNDYFPPLWLVPWFDFTHFNYNNYKIVSNKLLNSLNDDSLPINSCIVELPIASNSFSSGVTISIKVIRRRENEKKRQEKENCVQAFLVGLKERVSILKI
ncbi:uncharacterized protein LOC143225834 isoform X1 [Tachypleus tridentatus]|uniref:uncharacterized protein LOC143225834 isoform X1 n=1 Tax=Tachypleus tridentatus TaxID=6853 RepID=UPI003FD02D46